MSVPGRIQLCESIWKGDLDGVKRWLSRGNLEAANWRGWTPLTLACQAGYPAIVEYMESVGANVSVKDKQGRTLLHHVRRSMELVDFLLDSGLDVNKKDRLGNTPLHACDPDELHVVRRLLEAGADIHATNNTGLTPFHKFFNHDIAKLFCVYCNEDDPCKRKNCKCNTSVFECNVKRLLRRYPSSDRFLFHAFMADIINIKESVLFDSQEENKYFHYFGLNATHMVYIRQIPQLKMECKAELERMRTELVGDSSATFASVWSGSSLVRRNPSVQAAMLPENCLQKFPFYGEMLRKRFVDGTKWEELFDRAVESFEVHVALLPECIERVFRFLGLADLRAVTVACRRRPSKSTSLKRFCEEEPCSSYKSARI